MLPTTPPTLVEALTDRTLMLATAGADIPRSRAGAMTGLKPQRVGLLLDEGILRPGPRSSPVRPRSLVDYLVRTTDGLVTLFDFLHHKTERAGAASRLQGKQASSARSRLTKAADQHGLPRYLLRLTSMPPLTPSWEKRCRGWQRQALADMHASTGRPLREHFFPFDGRAR